MIEPVESLALGAEGSADEGAETTATGSARSYLSAEEHAMVARAIAGDQRALRQFYETYQAQVRGHLFRLLGPDPDVDDVLQTVFARAFTALERFQGKSTISTWLYRITANTSHNLLRQRFRRDRVKTALAWLNRGRGTSVQPGRVEARDEASRILKQLRPDLREVFVLYHYEGLTLQEISNVLGKPVSTVGDRLTRGRKRLRDLVAAD